MDEKTLLSKEYSITLQMFGDAFKDFQKKFAYPKNILMTLAFGFIGASYIPPLIKDPSNSICVMIIIVCVFLIAGIWLNTLMIRKNLMNSIEGIQGDKYIACLFENGMSISTVEISSESKENTDEALTEDAVPEKDEEDDFFADKEEENVPAGTVKTVIDFVNDDVKILEKKDYISSIL